MKINKSNIVKVFCTILLLGIIAASCRQDPIFHIITTETAPIPPRIPGAPTNMVAFERNYLSLIDPADPDLGFETKTASLFFVASGKLHWYGKQKNTNELPGWDRDYGIPQPGGKVISLAVTDDYLYALSLNSNNSLGATLRRIGHSDLVWTTISNGASSYPLIQSIYADIETGQLFAGARTNSKTSTTYAILYLDKNNVLQELKRQTEMLSGVAYRNNTYYLCTRGDGIFRISEANLKAGNISTVLQLRNIRTVYPPSLDPEVQEGNRQILFMSMIKLEDESIIAIERDSGTLYEILDGTALQASLDILAANSAVMDVDNRLTNTPSLTVIALEETARKNKDTYLLNALNLYKLWKALQAPDCGAFSQMFSSTGSSITTGGYATGAFAPWKGDALYGNSNIKRLVAGRQGTLFSTSYNNGYIEFGLKPDGSFDKDNPRPSLMVTVDSEDRYSTSLKKHPINHLFQAPREVDDNMTFFASTQTGGLWSYRDRSGNGGWQWNAED